MQALAFRSKSKPKFFNWFPFRL